MEVLLPLKSPTEQSSTPRGISRRRIGWERLERPRKRERRVTLQMTDTANDRDSGTCEEEEAAVNDIIDMWREEQRFINQSRQ